ncbi:MAG: hypothetical protein WAO90_12250 [Mycobacterium sp.]
MPNALLHGLPVLLAVVVIALIYRRMGTRRAIYELPQPWTHGPVLWAATGEVIPAGRHGHSGHHGHHGHGDEAFTVGGGASGHW